jgi:hypothetical protein
MCAIASPTLKPVMSCRGNGVMRLIRSRFGSGALVGDIGRVALGVLSLWCVAGQSVPPAAAQDPWASLEHKTGWILVGVVDAKTNEWAAVPLVAVKKTSDSKKATQLPAVGAVVEINQKSSVVIVNYRKTGEWQRLASPASRRTLEADITDVVLTPGRSVEVVELRRDKPNNGIQGVWARVVPSKSGR